MKKKTIFYITFFIVLALGFYGTFVFLIPGFGEPKFPVRSIVKPFRFINQDGLPVTDQDMNGRVYLAEYFFTTCPNICPMLNNNMRKVYDRYKEVSDFQILSFTCDPDRDSAQQLKKYSDSMQVNTKQWIFLTGRKDSLYNTARYSYLLDDPKNNLTKIEDQFMHTQFWALVDKNGQVRKIYDGLKDKEVEEALKDIDVLLKEAPTQKRFVNNLFQK